MRSVRFAVSRAFDLPFVGLGWPDGSDALGLISAVVHQSHLSMFTSLPIEILEDRIAPAVLFVTNIPGETFKVVDSGGLTLAGNTQAAGEVGANFAISLAKGDSLVFDANGDQILNGNDVLLMKVSSGRAMAFLTDVDSDGLFQNRDFTGLAVGDSAGKSFSGSGNAGINGSVATMLDSSGNLTIGTLQPTSIAGLKLVGQVGDFNYGTGNIVAGGSISKISIKSPVGGATGQSVAGFIATGTAAAEYASVSFSPYSAFGINFEPALGAAGGDITGVKLASGAQGIIAGRGADSYDDGEPETTEPAAGKGGSISNISLGLGSTNLIAAGAGGYSDVSAGGAGGSISGLKGVSYLFGDILTISAGNGGAGVTGGLGGSIEKTTVGVFGYGLYVTAGTGGDSMIGDGAAGGAITKAAFQTQIVEGEIVITAGAGGLAGEPIVPDGDVASDALAPIGGNGGDISGLKLSSNGASQGAYLVNITAGAGGSGSVGGAGGAVSNASIKLGTTIGSLSIAGGSGAEGYTAGGDGGALTGLKLTLLGVNEGVSLMGGAGGVAYGASGIAGAGGKVDTVSVTNQGFIGGYVYTPDSNIGSSLLVLGGAGGQTYGDFNFDGGTGGVGGDVSNFKLKNVGGIRTLGIIGGSGGNGQTTGGNAGSVTTVALGGSGAFGDVYDPETGITIAGGNAQGDQGEGGPVTAGGNGGSVSSVTIKHTGVGTTINLSGGNGSQADGPDGIAGIGGSVTGSSISALHSVVNVYGGTGGSANGEPQPPDSTEEEPLPTPILTATGGAGGSVSGLTLKAGQVNIFAGTGGDALYGQAGVGGEISTVGVTALGPDYRGGRWRLDLPRHHRQRRLSQRCDCLRRHWRFRPRLRLLQCPECLHRPHRRSSRRSGRRVFGRWKRLDRQRVCRADLFDLRRLECRAELLRPTPDGQRRRADHRAEHHRAWRGPQRRSRFLLLRRRGRERLPAPGRS